MTKRKLPLSHFLSLPSTSRFLLVLFLFLVLLVVPFTDPSKSHSFLTLTYQFCTLTGEDMTALTFFSSSCNSYLRVRLTFWKSMKYTFWNQILKNSNIFLLDYLLPPPKQQMTGCSSWCCKKETET